MDAIREIKGYQLGERIGTGGFGAVYKAHQSTVGREVAIKIILPGLANQPDFIRRFEAEAQLVARLEHPHITPLYDYWRDPDGAYLVMRWLRGGSLHDALTSGPFELRAAALLLDQVAGALSLAHRSGVIHRDIKPGNILLDEDGNAYLTDFGIAKDLNIAGGGTQQEAIVGSLDYISPEQARSEPVTPRTDIYSLGVTMYEVIVGEHPFPNLSSVERLYKHINDPLPEIVNVEDAISDALNRVIQKATAKNPEGRYPDALAFAADFREAVGMNRTPTNIETLLTQREHEILHLIIAGKSNKEIAQELTVTIGTVKWYVNQIYSKLGVRSRVQAIVRARELNLLGGIAEDIAPHIPTEDFMPENPYKGLRAFQSADHDDFFGREKITARLVQRMSDAGDAARFLAVVGPSGSGKSSLVKAGLIPALWRGELPGSEKWFVVEMLPGAHPLDELEIALIKVAAQHAGNLREQLDRDANGLVRVAQLLLPNDGSDLLLVIDQFEEVFTLVENESERQRFLDLLYAAVCAPRSRVRIVITLRADFYDRPLHYPQFGELVRTRLETIMPLSADELERAVTRPAARVGVSFEAGLAASIVADVNYQPGALPLLQYALTELFERRQGHLLTREAYEAIGKTVGALAKRAEDVYRGLDEAGQAAAQQMFLRLVTLGEGTEDTRRRTARSELLAIAADGDLMDEVIDTFAAYRLLALDNEPGTRSPTVEVAHEALLREWERLRLWLDKSRDDIRIQRQLGVLAAEWREAKQNVSYLARGSRLEQFAKWANETTLALTPHERAYLEASIAQTEAETKAEAARQAREKTLERRSQTFLRGLVAVLLVATLGAFVLTGAAVSNANSAQEARATSDANAQLSQSLALASGAQAALTEGNVDLALSLAVAANQIDQPPALAQRMLFEAAYGPGMMRVFTGHTDAVRSVAVSPDGRRLLSASQDGTLILWDAQTGEAIRHFTGHDGNVWSVVFHPDGRRALSGSADGTMILWDLETAEPIRRFTGHTADVRAVAISPDGSTALSASYDHSIILWNLETGAQIRSFLGHEDQVWTVAYSSDGRTMLSGSGNQDSNSPDTTMRLWNLETGEEIRRFEGHTDTVRTVAFSPDGRMALSGSFDKTLMLWDLETGQAIRRFAGHTGRVTGVAFRSDGHTAISSSTDTTLILWNLATGQAIHQFRGHSDAVVSVALGPDGHSAFSAAHDRTLRSWDLESTAEVYRLPSTLPVNVAMFAAFSPDGETMTVRLGPTNVALRDSHTGQVIRYFEGYESDDLYTENFDTSKLLRGVAYSPDGRTVATGREGGGWILWDPSTGQPIRRYGEDSGPVWGIAFSPDGRLLAAMGETMVRLWDVETGTEVRRFEGYTDTINALAFSPDGRYLAAGFGTFTSAIGGGTNDTSLRVWDITTGDEIQHLEHPAQVTGVAFSPDGQTLFSSSYDGALREWDFKSGQQIRQLVGSDSGITQMALSSDGRYIITGAYSGEAVIWRAATGEQLRHFRTAGEPTTVAFSPDGAYALLGGATDNILHVWRLSLDLDQLLDWTYANREVRELTCTERELYRVEPPCDPSDHSVPFTIAAGTDGAIRVTENAGNNTGRLEAQETPPAAQTGFSSERFALPMSFGFGSDWHITDNFADLVTVKRGQVGWEVGFNIVTHAEVADPVSGDRIPFPENFAAWIQANPDFQTDQPVEVMIGGVQGLQIDATPVATTKKALLFLSGISWDLTPTPERWRFILLDDVNGEKLLILIIAPAEQFEDAVQNAQPILDSVVFSSSFHSSVFELPLSLIYSSEWYIHEEHSDVVTLRMHQEPSVDFAFLTLDNATIAGLEAPYSSVPFPDNFASWIQSHGLFQVDETRSVLIDGFQGTEIDVTAASACGSRRNWIFFSRTGWVCGGGEFLRFIYLNDVHGERVLILITGGPLSGEDLDAGLDAVQVILDSVVFSN